ncbi:MAG: hypothetical protein GY948_16350 [Alphaproteobacteria bacterium]|nr:hypothetical protein [Alphaproteobacteria bacterium]
MTVIFVGPTIQPEMIEEILPATFLPPAKQGDVYKAALNRPRVIGIIDGYFQGELSIWHKEILWAMAQGIHVFGCSSMGALRAAELHKLGMHGIGRVFEAYRDGVIEDDDEVAMLHGPPETGFLPLTEPMVNVRATLNAAVDGGIIDGPFGTQLCEVAKATFYQELTWDNLLTSPEAGAHQDGQLDRLRAWLPHGKIDAKRDDALEMAHMIASFQASDPAPMNVDYSFEWTHLWENVTAAAAPETAADDEIDQGVTGTDVLNELRLDPEAYRQYRLDALLRLLVLKESHFRHGALGRQELREGMKQFRLKEGLFSGEALEAWLGERKLSLAQLNEMVEDDLRTERVLADASEELGEHILDALRRSPEFMNLLDRARNKKVALEGAEEKEAEQEVLRRSKLEILHWYFETQLKQSVPEVRQNFIHQLDFPDAESFYQVLAREYLIKRRLNQNSDLANH